MASEVLLTISKDEVERARLMSEYKYELDTQSKLVHAKREGIKEGMQQGIERGKEKSAKNLLAKGMPIEEIAQVTELTIERIRSLVRQ